MSLPREDDGTLPYYAWPGGYQIVYLDHHDDTLCPKCANELENDPDTLLDGLPLNHFIYWEGPDIYCDECEEPIKSAYGDPWEEKRHPCECAGLPCICNWENEEEDDA